MNKDDDQQYAHFMASEEELIKRKQEDVMISDMNNTDNMEKHNEPSE